MTTDRTPPRRLVASAIVLGVGAPRWLGSRQIPARLVFADDSVVTVAGWPDDRGRVA